MGLELCCAILSKVRSDWPPEKRQRVIETVIAMRNHIRPIGGWPKRDPRCDLVDIAPDYSLSNAFLAEEYDRNAETVLSAIKTALRSPDPNRRTNACGVVRGLMRLRPLVGNVFATALATTLELVENEFGESADDAAGNTLAEAFLIDPEAIDGILADHIKSRNTAVQEQLIEVYTRILRTRTLSIEDDAQADDDRRVPAAVGVALRRVLQLLQDPHLDIDPLVEAAQAIRTASRDHPDEVIPHRDVLLGTMAEWSLQSEARPTPPTILLPDSMPKPPALAAMEKHSRDLRWRTIKQELGGALGELVEAFPDQFAEPLSRSFENLDSKTHFAFKGEVTRLLGVVGQKYELLARVLPVLWSALMDSSSAFVRSRGVEAIGNCFGYSKQAPPSDVVAILVLHLNDSYTAVHQAAVRAIGDNADWLTKEQAIEALQRLEVLLQTYKSKGSRELERIADTLLDVSRRFPRTRVWAVKQVLSLMPSGDGFLDGQLIERLLRGIRPAEPVALVVAPAVLRWIGAGADDDDNNGDGKDEALSWLHGLSPSHFKEIRPFVVEYARKTAKNIRLVLSFASLFAANQDYQGECDALALARSELPAGRRYEMAARNLETLAHAASRNAARSGSRDN
jgi:hypothetical protein